MTQAWTIIMISELDATICNSLFNASFGPRYQSITDVLQSRQKERQQPNFILWRTIKVTNRNKDNFSRILSALAREIGVHKAKIDGTGQYVVINYDVSINHFDRMLHIIKLSGCGVAKSWITTLRMKWYRWQDLKLMRYAKMGV